MKLSSKIEKCSLSPIQKFDGCAAAAEARGMKIYHFNIGQPDIITPPVYFDVLKNYSAPILTYAPSEGIPELISAMQGYYRRIGVSLEKENILISSGGSEAFMMAFASILDDGDEILIPEPYYTNYATSIILTGASIRAIPTSPEEGYRYADREKIEPLINSHTRAIVITNPGNPTGVVLKPEELKLLLDIAKEHDLYIICDEVYREFVYTDAPLVSALQYPGYEQNIVLVDSVSKRFSACGARVGALISKNRELMTAAMKWIHCRLAVASADQLASAALYHLPENYFDDVRTEYHARRDTMVRKLSEIPGISFTEPDGAFYIMASLPVDDAEKFQMWLLNEFNDNGDTLMFSPAEPFYATPDKGRNEVRLAYVIKREDLERGLDVLAAALKVYNQQK